MQKNPEERASLRRCFKAWEICASHLEDIRQAEDEEEALWCILREAEQDKTRRFLLWVDVVTAAKVYWNYEFKCIGGQP